MFNTRTRGQVSYQKERENWWVTIFLSCHALARAHFIQQYKIIPFLKLMHTHISPWLWIAFHASSQLYRLTSYYFSRVLLLAPTIPISFPYLTHTHKGKLGFACNTIVIKWAQTFFSKSFRVFFWIHFRTERVIKWMNRSKKCCFRGDMSINISVA